mgnify:CR=1 FL=1
MNLKDLKDFIKKHNNVVKAEAKHLIIKLNKKKGDLVDAVE